jgi:hypothetical protein
MNILQALACGISHFLARMHPFAAEWLGEIGSTDYGGPLGPSGNHRLGPRSTPKLASFGGLLGEGLEVRSFSVGMYPSEKVGGPSTLKPAGADAFSNQAIKVRFEPRDTSRPDFRRPSTNKP